MSSGSFEIAGKKVWVAGHNGMVGSALVRRLRREPVRVITAARSELDLLDEAAVGQWFGAHRPEVVFLAAAKVGGIVANDVEKTAFLQENIRIQTNVIRHAAEYGVQRLVFLGSSCVYPRHAAQPISEDALLSGPLEPTNQWYAIAKISGLKLCEAYYLERGLRFSSAMPTNLYGPNDNFDLQSSHVLPALMRKIHDAKVANAQSVPVWGTGTVLREFLHVDDCADALVHVARHQEGGQWLNVGTGKDITIRRLAELIAEVVGWSGQLVFDTSKPDGTPRKVLDTSKLAALGWNAGISLREGIRKTYEWYLEAGDPTCSAEECAE